MLLLVVVIGIATVAGELGYPFFCALGACIAWDLIKGVLK